jgi:hypothetical protein
MRIIVVPSHPWEIGLHKLSLKIFFLLDYMQMRFKHLLSILGNSNSCQELGRGDHLTI